MKEDATLHFGSIQQLKKVETITKSGDSSNLPSIELLRHQLEEKDQLIASLRKSIEVCVLEKINEYDLNLCTNESIQFQISK